MVDGALRVLTWNLFHGRDHPPEPGLATRRSRLWRRTERGARHAQVNVDLFEQFAALLAAADWDVALLQECPPRWAEDLAIHCRADPHRVMTARNLPAGLSAAQRLAARFNPDLIASWEGGSNLTLVRGSAGTPAIVERRELTLARRPETRRMAFSRLRSGICVANLHASQAAATAEQELRAAADNAVRWAGTNPLILGGDLNLRPAAAPLAFAALTSDQGFSEPAGRDSVDHILARGLELIQPPARWAAEAREVADPTASHGVPALPIRLSDHAPVEAAFALPAS